MKNDVKKNLMCFAIMIRVKRRSTIYIIRTPQRSVVPFISIIYEHHTLKKNNLLQLSCVHADIFWTANFFQQPFWRSLPFKLRSIAFFFCGRLFCQPPGPMPGDFGAVGSCPGKGFSPHVQRRRKINWPKK